MANEELKVKITANTAQFLSAVKNVNSSLGGLMSKVASFQMSTIGMSAAIGALGAAFTKIILSSADYGDQLHNTSQKIGISVTALSGLQYAANIANVENETLATGIKKLSVNISESAKEFKLLGISQSELKTLTTDEILLKIADRFAEMKDGAGKTALAIKLFGKSGSDLIPLLNEGSSGIKKMTDKASRFGLVITAEAAAAADQFNDNLGELKGTVSGLETQIGNALIPAINDLFTALEKAAKSEGWKLLTGYGRAKSLVRMGIEAGESLGTALGNSPPTRNRGAGEQNKPEKPKKPKKKNAPNIPDETKITSMDAAENHRYKLLEDGVKAESEYHAKIYEAQNKSNDDIMNNIEARMKKRQEEKDKELAAEEEGLRRAQDIQQKKQDVILGSLAFISRSALREHKAFFAIVKAADIAQATMDTYTAATKALATVPYPFNFAVAGLITAAGMANVAQIAGTGFGGGGSRGGGGGGAVGSATSGAGVGSPGATYNANPTQSIQVIVHGNIIDHAAFVRELQPYFKEIKVDTL